ncbi:hypothetical protein [Arenimonas daejeonensis]|uniref:hypothetical protein n=1 Tax=Arenimonas daejeonensis TaxID=370777 RepID=UPI0011BDEA73|nr:hypothetical protein [Arenimonas daejeonensis]
MTTLPTLPPKQQALFDEIGLIGRRVEAGEITEDEAKILTDDVMARLRAQTVQDVEMEMGQRLKARQRKALLILGVLAVAVAVAGALVVLR